MRRLAILLILFFGGVSVFGWEPLPGQNPQGTRDYSVQGHGENFLIGGIHKYDFAGDEWGDFVQAPSTHTGGRYFVLDTLIFKTNYGMENPSYMSPDGGLTWQETPFTFNAITEFNDTLWFCGDDLFGFTTDLVHYQAFYIQLFFADFIEVNASAVYIGSLPSLSPSQIIVSHDRGQTFEYFMGWDDYSGLLDMKLAGGDLYTLEFADQPNSGLCSTVVSRNGQEIFQYPWANTFTYRTGNLYADETYVAYSLLLWESSSFHHSEFFLSADEGLSWQDMHSGLELDPWGIFRHDDYFYAAFADLGAEDTDTSYVYRARVSDFDGISSTFKGGPATFSLNCAPNPFNPATTIEFTLDAPGRAVPRVFDVRGRLVRTLLDGPLGSGTHRVSFAADGLPSGVYFYRLETPTAVGTRKMVLVR